MSNAGKNHEGYQDPTASKANGWDSNPFAWVIEFERIEKGVELE